ncbi:hypothetical protein [Haloferula sargassicola]|uniref:Uncharacterized protein n=1 Tax=Haloferula sargassicola TaxID=490096 RepID=A0ABP9UXH2_9BACT
MKLSSIASAFVILLGLWSSCSADALPDAIKRQVKGGEWSSELLWVHLENWFPPLEGSGRSVELTKQSPPVAFLLEEWDRLNRRFQFKVSMTSTMRNSPALRQGQVASPFHFTFRDKEFIEVTKSDMDVWSTADRLIHLRYQLATLGNRAQRRSDTELYLKAKISRDELLKRHLQLAHEEDSEVSSYWKSVVLPWWEENQVAETEQPRWMGWEPLPEAVSFDEWLKSDRAR